MLDLENAIVLLTSKEPDNNKAFGSAFIIAQDNSNSYLLTCAHVVEQINHHSAENKLKLLSVDKSVEIVCCGSSETIDIALLKVAGLLDKPAFALFSTGSEGNPIKVTGYSSFDKQTGLRSRRPLDGKLGKSIMLASKTADTQFPAWDVHIDDDDLSKLDSGYSGSPLYSSEGEIITVMSHRRSGDKGHAFCISNLRSLYPEITRLIPAFKNLDKRSRIATIRTGLMQRMADIMPVFKIIATRVNQLDNQAIDDETEVILTVCEAFIDGSTAASVFVEFCRSLSTESASVNNDQPNYNSLAKRLNAGEIAICIGTELAPTSDAQLKSVSELPQAISALASFENMNTQALAEVCEYAELHTDCRRHAVVTALQTLLTPPLDYRPDIALYELLANLQKPFLVLSSGFDTLLEQRLANSGKRFVSIIANNNADSAAERLFLSYSDKENYFCSDEQLSALRLMEEGYSLIFYPRGNHDNLQDTLLLSERDYFNATDLLNNRYPAYLHNKLKGRGLWFLGYHPDSWETRMLAKVLQYQRRNNRDQPLVIQQQANDFAKFFWDDLKCRHYNDIDLNEFIVKIGESL